MQITEKELKAGEIFRTILKEFLDQSHPDSFKKPFLSEKRNFENSTLFKVLKLFPKGALLHLHWVSSGRNETLSNYITSQPTIFYEFTQDGHPEHQKGEIRYFRNDPGAPWKRIDKIIEEMGKDTFVQECLDKMGMNADDEVGSSERRWKHFQSIFNNYLFGLSFFKPVARQFHLEMVESFVEDNVQYAEYRCPFTYMYDENERKLTQRETAECFASFAKEAQEKFGEDQWLGGKWVQESMRMYDREKVRTEMDSSYELQNDMPETVFAFDLVGEEDGGHLCEYFAQDVLELKEKARQEGKVFNVAFHLGETNHPVKNIESGIDLGTLRIGHGYNIMRFPDQVNRVKELDIPLEVCPVSNIVMGLVQDRRNHPMVNFLAHKVPFVISSDDPQLWQYTGVTHDFFLLATAAHITLPQLKQVALNSIKYSHVTEEDRSKLLSMWEKKYEQWLDVIIQDYVQRMD
eukprot:CAMPEP_0117451506 /NCGR_PEP_ID=MMETSP0759-20121206/9045_1 /TAXON_ID=63605 /ORGANISM="Percolomonas cosmopolitus, Strain WS" /LENGTH=461 /DNA_ID=CAMNT_0005244113 /DNA_START=62 /DNA_END=1447 /DNA_ORIENTATION=+